MGYAEAAGELQKQLENQKLNIDYIFFASSSGGMQAGLMLGMKLHGLESKLMPVGIDKEEPGAVRLEEQILAILKEGEESLKLNISYSIEDIPLLRHFYDAGYGVVTENEKTAIQTLARTEGIILDPVYTGRAFYGMMHYLQHKLLRPDSNVLFWHTGGLPANFEYADQLF